MTLLTPRLTLRPMEPRDLNNFLALNSDPDVMRFFAGPYEEQKSREHFARYQAQQLRDGFGFLTLESRGTGEYLGFVGMQPMIIAVPNLPQPAVEIGWRLAKAAHGHGYATEAARAVLRHAFRTHNLPEVVAVIATGNTASRRVAEKLGMILRPELAFDHPLMPEGHEHRPHVLYSLRNETECSTPL